MVREEVGIPVIRHAGIKWREVLCRETEGGSERYWGWGRPDLGC